MKLLEPIRQIAYSVQDVKAAAEEHARLYGSGPFFFAEHVPVSDYKYRGQPGEWDHTTIVGQWGEVMVEFFQQHNPGPSHVHDMYPYGSNQSGIHHVALIVNDLEESIQHFLAQGFELASHFRLSSAGFDVAMIDTRRISGHMVELYMGVEPILALYEMTKQAAKNFDGRDLIRPMNLQTASPRS